RLPVGAGAGVAQLIVDRRLAGLSSQPLEEEVARDREQVALDRRRPDRLGGRPGAHERLRRDVLRLVPVAREVEREPEYIRGVTLVERAEVGHPEARSRPRKAAIVGSD